MKKSQVVVSALLTSTLGLTNAVAPIVYAVEAGDDIIADVEAVARTWDDIIELFTSLDMESWGSSEEYGVYEQKFVTNQAVIDAGILTSDSNAMKALVNTFFNRDVTATNQGTEYGLVSYLATTSSEGQALKNAAEVYTLLMPGFKPEDVDEANVERIGEAIDFAIAETGATAVQDWFDKLADTTFDITNRTGWTTADYYNVGLAASLALDDGDIKIGKGTGSISIATEGFEAYERVKAYYDAVAEQEAYASDTGAVGKYYAYWTLESELPDLDTDDTEAVNNYYNRLAELVDAINIPTKSDEPILETRTLTSADETITVTGVFPADYTLVVEASDERIAGEDYEDAAQIAYDIYIVDGKGEEVEIDQNVTVTVKVPADMDATKTEVYHIDSEGKAEPMTIDLVADDVITFSTDSLSPYVLVEKAVAVVTPEEPTDPVTSDDNQDDDQEDVDTDQSTESTTESAEVTQTVATVVTGTITLGDGTSSETSTSETTSTTVETPNTGAATAKTNATATTGLMAGIIATASATIAAVACALRRLNRKA